MNVEAAVKRGPAKEIREGVESYSIGQAEVEDGRGLENAWTRGK